MEFLDLQDSVVIDKEIDLSKIYKAYDFVLSLKTKNRALSIRCDDGPATVILRNFIEVSFNSQTVEYSYDSLYELLSSGKINDDWDDPFIALNIKKELYNVLVKQCNHISNDIRSEWKLYRDAMDYDLG